jgi:hypothetical protein
MDRIEINMSRYSELLDKERRLDALEAGGVDNWEGYDFSLDAYWKETEEND